MRVITKRIFIAILTLTVGLAVVSCGGSNDTATTTTTSDSVDIGLVPKISNPDQVFYSTDDYQITYEDLFDNIKINRGLQLLLDMVDKDLLSSYIDAVTDEQVATKTKDLIYGTTDDTEIANMSAEDKAQDEADFATTLLMSGYSDNQEEYIKLVCAKENYAIDTMKSDDSANDSWYAGPSAIATKYENSYYPDLTSIKIKFSSLEEATDVMHQFKIVSLDGTLKLYTGSTPLDQLPSNKLDSSNTTTLTNQQLLQKFIEMFNYKYQGTYDAIDTNATVPQLKENQELKINYEDMKNINQSLANYMFSTLGNYEDYSTDNTSPLYFTYKPVKYLVGADNAYYMIMNISSPKKVDLSDFDGDEADLVALIGQTKYDEIQQDIIQSNLDSSGFVSNRMSDLRAEHNFVMYDYYMQYDYQNIHPIYDINTDGSETILASYDDVQITPDQFLTNVLNMNAKLYLVSAAQDKALMASHYEDIYCPDSEDACEYNFIDNTSAAMLANIDKYNNLEDQFQQSGYASYYKFEEYLYLAYGAKNENEMLGKYYVKSSLQPLYLYDHLSDNDYAILKEMQQYIDFYYNNYFNLDVLNLEIYFDKDEDGSPDNYSDFYDGLTDKTAYDNLLADFEQAIRDYLANNDDDVKAFASAYQAASMDDATWGQYKTYGFKVKETNMSSSASLTYKTALSKGLDQSYIDALEALYNAYILPENQAKDFMYSDSFIETSDGVNLIYATPGDEFAKPTFKFAMTYDGDNNPMYTVGLENENDTYTLEQLKLFAEYRINEILGDMTDLNSVYGIENPVIPDSLMDAYNAYFVDVYNTIYNVGYLNMLLIDELLNGTFTNEVASYCSVSDADLRAGMNSMYQVFSDDLFSSFADLK